MRLSLILLFIFSGVSALGARPKFYDWNSVYSSENKTEFGTLEFANRAQCAQDSTLPAREAFLIINNADMGKSLYRLQKMLSYTNKDILRQGIRRFRYAFVSMAELIIRRLDEGSLPLLQHNLENIDNEFAQISKSCEGRVDCFDMIQFLDLQWKTNEIISPLNLLGDNVLLCEDVQRVDELQANLFGVKPNKDVLDRVASSYENYSKNVSKCSEEIIKFKSREDLKGDLYKFTLNIKDKKQWDKVGFDFWYSLKLYLSFAYRYANEMQEMAYPFNDVFNGTNVEESFLFVSSNCRSIDNPKCDGPNLSQQVLRSFAKQGLGIDRANEAVKAWPKSPDELIVENKFPKVNTDILSLKDFESSSEWVDEFNSNLIKTKETVKKKLLKATNFLYFSRNLFNSETFQEKVLSTIRAYENRDNTEQDLHNLYYLCHEYFFAQDETIGFLYKDIKLMSEEDTIKDLIGFINLDINETYDNFANFAKSVINTCNSIDQNAVFKNHRKDVKGFSDWYVEKIYDNKVRSKSRMYVDTDKKGLLYLDKSKDGESLCYDEIDCARTYLNSMIDLYAVSTYANALWSAKGLKQSANLFNPYSERVACGAYDPWYRTKSIFLNLVTDLSMSALTLTTPGLIFASVDLRPKLVTSFNKLVEDGVIKFDPKADHRRVSLGLTADFGPLLGTPCAVSIANSEINPLKYYHFRGISVGACQPGQTSHKFTAYSATDNESKKTTHSECVSCTLNFETAATALTSMAEHVGPVYFLVRAFFRLIRGYSDPYNIPKSWNVDIDQLLLTQTKYGQIPERCVKDLSKGKGCLRSRCELKALEKMNKEFKNFEITSSAQRGVMGYNSQVVTYFKTKQCEEPIKVYMSANKHRCSQPRVRVPKNCQLEEK